MYSVKIANEPVITFNRWIDAQVYVYEAIQNSEVIEEFVRHYGNLTAEEKCIA